MLYYEPALIPKKLVDADCSACAKEGVVDCDFIYVVRAAALTECLQEDAITKYLLFSSSL